MKAFMDDGFLLNCEAARALFDECRNEPIFDWHCHLSPKEIYENKTPSGITELWLGGDHYKWRAMRTFGVDEKYVTGNAPDDEKFRAWAATVEQCVGNPLYHWTHLELQRYFGIYEPLTLANADAIREKADALIRGGGYTPRELISRSGVKCVCTTDDAADSLEYHELIKRETSFGTSVLPAFRPDKALNIDAPGYSQWCDSLQAAAGIKVDSFEALLDALSSRIDFFASMGCRASDHALTVVTYEDASSDELESIFKAARSGEKLSAIEVAKYRTALMRFFAGKYSGLGWGMEIHIGALRNNNRRLFRSYGPDVGCDSVADGDNAAGLSALLGYLDEEGRLPKTILFDLNPKDNFVLATMAGNFQGGSKGKIQFGPAWWFSDSLEGMRKQLADFSTLSVLGTFIGMTTDSRSFLSYPRHEYFRRILCGFIGDKVENGEYPFDIAVLSRIVRNISYANAAEYFGIV